MHKFAVGQAVYLESHMRGLRAVTGSYTVTRLLPTDTDAQCRYRIKNATETFERVVTESQLSRSA
jgi:hypothetical protein